MNQLKTTDLGGFPFKLDDLRWMSNGITEAIKGYLSQFPINDSNAFIISGCEFDGSTYSPGFISIGGEICYFPGSSSVINPYWSIGVSFDPTGSKVFQNTDVHDTYEIRIAQLSSFIGSAPPAGYTSFAETKNIRQLIREQINIGEWINVTGSGTDFSAQPAKSFKTAENFVLMKGQSIYEDDTASTSRLIGVLTSTHRPITPVYFVCPVSISSTLFLKRGAILTNGEIRIYETTSGTLQVNLSDLPNFRVD